MGRGWASCRCAGPGWPAPTMTAPRRPEAGRRTAGSGRVTSSPSIRRATCRSSIARRGPPSSWGGEWISSQALQGVLAGHPAVAEAAVVAIPDEKWMERPLAVIVFKDGKSVSVDELREALAGSLAIRN